MKTKPLVVILLGSLLPQTGCAAFGGAGPHRTQNLDADIVLMLLEPHGASNAEPAAWYGSAAPGPSLIAGDSIAFAWVQAHSGAADQTGLAIASWQPEMSEALD